ncbi:MAG: tyrosine-type recombinase/integrase [Gammaproteobacteria bacterium]|nr:tyrosine-type recombinase/integrase [Gammaproteobacteria bacterium]
MADTSSLNDLLPRFLRRCDAESTRLAYERELRRFLAWLPTATTAEVLFDYRDHLRERKLRATTIQWRTTVARAFLKFAADNVGVDAPSVGDFRPPKGTTGFVPHVLTRQQLNALIAAPDRRTHRGKRDALVLAFMGVGGLRAGEVCRLSRADIQLQSGKVVLLVSGKGRKQRLVPLSGPWVGPVRRYMGAWAERGGEHDAAFWCGQPGHEDRRLTVAAVDYIVRRHAASAGLVDVSSHDLRHTAASIAIDAGEPLHRLRDRLGHSSVLVTSRYLHA